MDRLKGCSRPWRDLIIDLGSFEARHCDASSSSTSLKDLVFTEHALDIANAHPFTQIRKSMLLEEVPEGCRACWSSESKGLRSERVEMREIEKLYLRTGLPFTIEDLKRLLSHTEKAAFTGVVQKLIFRFPQYPLEPTCSSASLLLDKGMEWLFKHGGSLEEIICDGGITKNRPLVRSLIRIVSEAFDSGLLSWDCRFGIAVQSEQIPLSLAFELNRLQSRQPRSHHVAG